MSTEVTLYPAASNDDATWFTGQSGDLGLASSVLILGRVGSDYHSVIRFPSVAIPFGSTILSAVLTLRCPTTDNTGLTCNGTISGEDTDTAAEITTCAQAEALVLTSANVAWNDIPAWTQGTFYDTPSLTEIIQEIVNRAGWVSGNNLRLVLRNNASSSLAFRYGSPYDSGNAAYYPKLVITYGTATEAGHGTSAITLPTPVVASTCTQSDNSAAITLPSWLITAHGFAPGVNAVSFTLPTPVVDAVSGIDGNVAFTFPVFSVAARRGENIALTFPMLTETGTAVVGAYSAGVAKVPAPSVSATALTGVICTVDIDWIIGSLSGTSYDVCVGTGDIDMPVPWTLIGVASMSDRFSTTVLRYTR